jgi:hypothetical protein
MKVRKGKGQGDKGSRRFAAEKETPMKRNKEQDRADQVYCRCGWELTEDCEYDGPYDLVCGACAAKVLAAATPKVGEGATFTVWTDSYACTVEAVSKSGTRATLRRDKATLLNGFKSGEADALTFTPGGFAGHTSGSQRYKYERDPDGQVIKVSRRVRNGQLVWKQVGSRTSSPGGFATFGGRHESYDYNF